MSIRFLVFSDLHYDTVEDGDERISKIIRKVKENQLDFCISLGDFCEPVLENKRLVNAFLQTRVPMYYTIGNHETDRHHLDEILVFYDMKSPFYSFELENYKFIVLNTCFYSKDGVEEVFYENNLRIPLERNSLHASAGRLSAPNGKFLSYTGLRMFLPFSSRRNAL